MQRAPLLVCVYCKQFLTYTLRRLLGRGVAIMVGPAVTLATVYWSLFEVKVAQRRLNATPLKWQEVFIWKETFVTCIHTRICTHIHLFPF